MHLWVWLHGRIAIMPGKKPKPIRKLPYSYYRVSAKGAGTGPLVGEGGESSIGLPILNLKEKFC